MKHRQRQFMETLASIINSSVELGCKVTLKGSCFKSLVAN